MIISARALKGSLKKGKDSLEHTLKRGPLASCEFNSKTSVGGHGNEVMSLDYKGRVTVMKKGLVIACAIFTVATVGCAICMKIKKKKEAHKNDYCGCNE